MGVDQSQLEQAVGAVLDPELDLALSELSMIRSVKARRRRVSVLLALPIAAWPNEDELEARIHRAALSVPGVEEVAVEADVMDDTERTALRVRIRTAMTGTEPAPTDEPPEDDGHDHGGHGHSHGEAETPTFLQAGSRTRIIGIGSGKGGVGKSSVTVNLAVALAQSGHSVGILDADVYGFSIPKMMGAEHDPIVLGDLVLPTLVHGVRCLSMGYFVPDDQPVIWRGPMLHKAIEQFLADAYWGEPDFLLVDMPPGTGDVTLSLAQVMPRAEVVVVTTPQAAAQRVAQRSAYAARKLKLSVRGVIENMSWFTGDDGTRYDLFGTGGGESLSKDLSVPLLGQVPLVPALRVGGDNGLPIMLSDPDGEASVAFRDLAERLVKLGPARVYRRELSLN